MLRKHIFLRLNFSFLSFTVGGAVHTFKDADKSFNIYSVVCQYYQRQEERKQIFFLITSGEFMVLLVRDAPLPLNNFEKLKALLSCSAFSVDECDKLGEVVFRTP